MRTRPPGRDIDVVAPIRLDTPDVAVVRAIAVVDDDLHGEIPVVAEAEIGRAPVHHRVLPDGHIRGRRRVVLALHDGEAGAHHRAVERGRRLSDAAAVARAADNAGDKVALGRAARPAGIEERHRPARPHDHAVEVGKRTRLLYHPLNVLVETVEKCARRSEKSSGTYVVGVSMKRCAVELLRV